MKKIIAVLLVLCAALSFSACGMAEQTAPLGVTLLPQLYFSAAQGGRLHSAKTVSDKGVALEYPYDGDYYDEPFTAYVQASREGGAIYIMPVPKSGNGNLGTVADGTPVTVYAERNGCYFFETASGQRGWNGTMFFTLVRPDKASKPAPQSGRPGRAAGTTLPRAKGETVSDKGVALELPAAADFYDETFTAYVQASRKGGAIYIMPLPKSGNGNLGTVADGSPVTVYAERNGCYFFVTEDGRQGWNGHQFFTLSKPGTPSKPAPSLNSGWHAPFAGGETVSTTGVALELPNDADFYDSPFTAYVQASRKGGAIYIMPLPKSGNGNLGTVADGTPVTVYAERNACFFFVTEDGRQGWNGMKFFTW